MSTTIAQIKKASGAAPQLRAMADKQLKKILLMLADELEKQQRSLLKANHADVVKQDPGNPRTDRLRLDEKRIKSIAQSIRKVSRLPNPSGKVLEKRTLKNGLLLEKIAVPLGVVGAIYESRPNVTFDIAALCIRSGNACVLKGSSEAENSNRAAVRIIQQVLKKNGLPGAVVTLLSSERAIVQELFTATRYVDVLIPRGSDGLIRYVRQNSLVPVIETGAGVCHVYVEKKADISKAVRITVNAKVSRPSVCNAMDALLVDQSIAPAFLQKLQPELEQYKVEIFADPAAYKMLKGYPYLRKAQPADFGREFLDLKCAVKVVKDSVEAVNHIREYSTKHSEAIVTEDKKQAEYFLHEVDAAAVYHNASTRFTDGEEFGLGAEIGISTQKLHARGPFALEKLVTEKWVIRGNGQVR
ncbi:glutamate-5-semialdehyde dehydrogenase [Agriterribacter sp.]|uniref:glutamate-5-semialdehyde dehydrogenase n=1 Tax=Agriterribacter sp. TaxID=2821509 RepID=UPI002CDF84A7|nr:glutamate-5-semialdehyde dehydrogenase [Agriterribacter sp.]HTN08328.1 glutamate-5-semialdehyde dehydrogenase [Agriterribacter sp.]